jgi:hypothetical protein
MKLAALIFVGLIASSSLFGQAKPYTPPRTPEGLPDFEGIWQPQQNNAMFSVLPHKPGFLLGTGSTTGIVEGGVLPYRPEAVAKVKYRLDHMEMDPTGHCHYEGIPHAMYFPFQVFETLSQITMVFENMHAYRIIHMQGQHPKDVLTWMGDSRGHWEGNTLVVDVANNNDKSVFDMAGHFHSDALHVVERYTPIDRDHINYDVLLEDPKVFTRPIKMHFSFKRAPETFQIMESGCFEGERDQMHFNDTVKLSEHYNDANNGDGKK